MCVSAFRAEFTGTNLYLGKKVHPLLGSIFVMGYQNKAQNFHSGPNAMIIHIPTKHIDKQNLLDMSSNKTVFKDFKTAVEPRAKGALSFASAVSRSASFQVVKHGIYDVIIADSARAIPEAMKLVEPEKRVYINKELIEFYAHHYPEYTITMWCFNSKDLVQSDPVFIWYKPIEENLLVFPAVDAHTGHAPDLTTSVQTDHYVFIGSDIQFNKYSWHEVYYDFYTDKNLKMFLPKFVAGERFTVNMLNGDFVGDYESIKIHATDALTRHIP